MWFGWLVLIALGLCGLVLFVGVWLLIVCWWCNAGLVVF